MGDARRAERDEDVAELLDSGHSMQNWLERGILISASYAFTGAALAVVILASCKPIHQPSRAPVAAANNSSCAGLVAIGGRYLTDSARALFLDSIARDASNKGVKLSAAQRASLRVEMDSVLQMRCAMDSLTAIEP